MEKKELEEVLRLHLDWYFGVSGGKRADLTGADLRSADLTGADLTGANLRSANLRSANLRSADLTGADLRSADLTGADLTGADLRSADLTGANLRSADLRSADLRSANLRSADLTGADLTGADLTGADLRSADLTGAKGVELAVARTRILAEGDLVGWKKCRTKNGHTIVKLRIPADAKRSHAFGRKCRAEFVDVLEVEGKQKAFSMTVADQEYVKGERVTADKWETDWMEECAGGIHFFITRAEAEDYV